MQALIAGLGDYKTPSESILPSCPRLEIQEDTFPDGERFHQIVSNVRKKDVILFSGTHDDRHFLDLVDVASACAKSAAKSLTLLIPYFGYSTMERATNPGEVIKAKVRARILSSIPQAKEGNQILFLDLHAAGIPEYLEGDTNGFPIYGESLVLEAIQSLPYQNTPYCLGSTDGGRSKWVQSLAKKLGVQAISADKTRTSGSEVHLNNIQGNCEGLQVVIYDDMIRTGGSLLAAAKGYLQAGAVNVRAVTTHGVFPNDSLRRILDTCHGQRTVIEKIVCLDSIPKVHQLKADLPKDYQGSFDILSTTTLWETAIRNYVFN